jgi:hypothetical protein
MLLLVHLLLLPRRTAAERGLAALLSTLLALLVFEDNIVPDWPERGRCNGL